MKQNGLVTQTNTHDTRSYIKILNCQLKNPFLGNKKRHIKPHKNASQSEGKCRIAVGLYKVWLLSNETHVSTIEVLFFMKQTLSNSILLVILNKSV